MALVAAAASLGLVAPPAPAAASARPPRPPARPPRLVPGGLGLWAWGPARRDLLSSFFLSIKLNDRLS